MTEVGKTEKLAIAGVGRIIDGLATIGGWLSGLCILAMAISVIIEIVSRYVFNQPTIWSLEITEYLMVMCAFLGAAFVLKEGRHITVDILISRLTGKTRVMLEIVTLIGTLVFCGILLWYGQKVLANVIANNEVSSSLLHLPMWIPKSTVPFGAGLLVLQVLKIMAGRVSLLYKGEAGAGVKINQLSLQNPAILLPLYIGVLAAETWLLLVNPPLAMVLLLFTLLLGGVPVAFSLGLAACIMLAVLYPAQAGLAQTPLVAFQALESFVLVAIPLFIFGASILSRGGLGEQLYDIATKWIGHLPGGLAMATVVSCGFFAAISGSSVATAATIGLIAIPMMLNRGYDKGLAYGTVATGGTLGSLIPPSLSMILYGSLTDVSVGKLFMGGFIPGIIEVMSICLLIAFFCRGGRKHTKLPAASWKERALSLKVGIWALLAPVIVLGGIYIGIFTPTEAAAVAVTYALIVTIFVLRTVGWKEMKLIITDSVKTTVMLLTIIIGALLFGHLVTYLQVPAKLMAAVSGFSPWSVMIMVNLFVLVMGCMLEGASIILITVPVVFPVIKAMGFNPIWFGIVFTANLEVAMMTPPVGMNLFVIQGITGARLSDVIRGALPFCLLQVFNLGIILLFPTLSLWLPGMMKW